MSTVSAAAAISISNFPSICRPVLAYSGTAQRSSYSRCFHPSVSRPAALPKLNLRGRCPVIVPANGCLAKLLLWSRNQVEGSSPPSQRFGNSQVQGNLRIPLTSTYHGCPRFFQLIKQRKTKSRATPVETASTAARRPQLPKTLRVGEHLLEMKVKQITTSPNRRAVPTTKATWFMLVEIATVLVVKAMLTQPILMMQLAKNGDYLEWKRIRRSNEC